MSDIKDRINKLLAMANHERGNEHESEVALRMATRLMTQHGIDAAELEDSTGKKTAYSWSSIVLPVGERAGFSNSRPPWVGFMALGVGLFTDCRVTWTRDNVYGNCIKFEGDAVDLEYAGWLFKRLRDHGYSESKTAPAGQRVTFRKAYGIRLQDRMKQLRRERDQAMREAVTKTGTALMVVQNKIALRDAEFGRQTSRTSRTTSRVASQGFHMGRAAADATNFSRPVGSTGGPRMLK